MPKFILLSIKPEYAQGILDGRKTIELRKRSMNLGPGDWVLLYATLPVGAIVGGFQVDAIISAHPADLWKKAKASALVSHGEFKEYYASYDFGHGLLVKRAIRLTHPISLTELRKHHRKFQPPQSFRNLDTYTGRLLEKLQHLGAGLVRNALRDLRNKTETASNHLSP